MVPRPIRISPPQIYVADTGTPKGLGVFAARDFAIGEVVEEAPALILGEPREGIPKDVRLRTFAWGKLAGLEQRLEAIVWGYGSLYNHENPANMRYQVDTVRNTIVFIADSNIPTDKELTINYNDTGGGPISQKDDWFARHRITPT